MTTPNSLVEEFSLIALPDTQYYSRAYPQHFNTQTQWIVDSVDALNIKYVLHLGDITHNNNIEQFDNAKEALGKLDGVVPYAIAPGNHDYGDNGNARDRNTLFLNGSGATPAHFLVSVLPMQRSPVLEASTRIMVRCEQTIRGIPLRLELKIFSLSLWNSVRETGLWLGPKPLSPLIQTIM